VGGDRGEVEVMGESVDRLVVSLCERRGAGEVSVFVVAVSPFQGMDRTAEGIAPSLVVAGQWEFTW
jgi:hypothetical protein